MTRTPDRAEQAALAALAPLAYWQPPAAVPAPLRPAQSALDQMFAYFD